MYYVYNGSRCVGSMETYRNVPRNHQLFILGILYFGAAVSDPSFLVEPSDYKQIFPYGSTFYRTVTLSCAVQYLEAGQSVAWYKDGVQISNNGMVYSGYVDTNRCTVVMSFHTLYQTFDLTITTYAVTADIDSAIYQCAVMTTSPLESRTARLDVFVTPGSGYLRCAIGDDSHDDVFDVETGTPIRLTCRSDPTGVPQMTTYWTREGSQGETLEIVTGTDTRDGSLVVYFTWTPTNQQNHATFICTGFHPGYTTNRACQLGPFNVQYKPIVHISPSPYTVTMETQVIYFNCIADANPPATRYVWGNTAGQKFSPQGTNVVIGSDGTWMQMRNFESQDNGVYYVTCYAENDIGRSVTAIATLNINIRSTTTVSVTEHSSTSLSTSTVSKQDGNVSSDGQHDMTSVVLASIDTSTVYDLGKISKTSQVNRVAIIGGTVGGCGFILIVFGVIFTTFCVCKSRKKSQRKESPDTHTVLNPYEDTANVNSVDFSQSPYSTVNDAYDTENNTGGTTNADSTSVEITLQARVFFKNTDRNKGDTGQSVIESDLFRVEKQGTSLSKTITDKTNCEKTETRNDFQTNDDGKQKSQTSGHRPIILPKPKQHLQSVERSPCQTNESGYDKAVLAEETTTTWRNGQSSDDRSDQKYTDISVMYASVDLSKKGKSKGLYEHSDGEENIEIDDEYHEETVGQQTTYTDESAQHKNVEGLTYADLDLSSTMPRLDTKRNSLETKQNDDTVYAEVRV